MLTCLEKLEEFKVLKEEGHKIDELKNMTRLRGQLRITNLENVDGRHDAAEARLNNKEHLTYLKLSWSPSKGTSSGIGNHVIDEDTIEGLQPHPNIGCLDINNYWGRTLPSWLQTEMLPHLFVLEISGCSNLESLESLFVPHQLSSLEVLRIKDCENILSLPLEWISNSSLIELSIVKCPRLSGRTNLILPSSLIYLHLDSCGEFDKSLSSCFQNSPPLDDLTLKNCQHITSLPSQVTNHLTGLCLSNCAELQYLDFTHPSTLVRVQIEKCPKLLQLDLSKADNEAPIVPNKQLDLLDIDNTSLLKLSFLRTPRCLLRYLNIINSPEERMFTGDAHGWLSGHENILHLAFIDCSNLESLPEELHTLATLQHLQIRKCPKIQSLPENGLPSSLKSLFYSGCHPALREQLKQHDKALET